jgi:hypothetical protein
MVSIVMKLLPNYSTISVYRNMDLNIMKACSEFFKL